MYRCNKLISEFITIGDEALAILIFENNIDTWMDMFKNNIRKNSKVARKYTNGGSSKGAIGSSRRFQGWSSVGIFRFNELFDLVEANCKSLHAKEFEVAFQNFCIHGGVDGKPMKMKTPLFETVEVRHELWRNDDEPTEFDFDDDQEKVMQPYQCMSGTINHNLMNPTNLSDSDEDKDPFGVKGRKQAIV